MLNLASSMTVVTPGSETAVHPDRSTRELTDSFIALIDNAEDRVRMMQNKAITEFTKREQRIIRFAAIKKRLKRIISDRLGVLTSQSLFSDAQLTYSDGVGCTAQLRRRHHLHRTGDLLCALDARDAPLDIA